MLLLAFFNAVDGGGFALCLFDLLGVFFVFDAELLDAVLQRLEFPVRVAPLAALLVEDLEHFGLSQAAHGAFLLGAPCSLARGGGPPGDAREHLVALGGDFEHGGKVHVARTLGAPPAALH